MVEPILSPCNFRDFTQSFLGTFSALWERQSALRSSRSVEDSEMAQLIQREMVEKNPRGEREKALKILAKSIFRELRTQGYDAREIVSLSTELLSLITTDIKPAK